MALIFGALSICEDLIGPALNTGCFGAFSDWQQDSITTKSLKNSLWVLLHSWPSLLDVVIEEEINLSSDSRLIRRTPRDFPGDDREAAMT
ncbi:hypothetical protein N9B35_00895 [bacterium]|nr:hypothetical protein [bacterium]